MVWHWTTTIHGKAGQGERKKKRGQKRLEMILNEEDEEEEAGERMDERGLCAQGSLAPDSIIHPHTLQPLFSTPCNLHAHCSPGQYMQHNLDQRTNLLFNRVAIISLGSLFPVRI